MSDLQQVMTLEYGAALSEAQRSGCGYPVYGSNGEVGRHDVALVNEPGIIVGRKGSVGRVSWSGEPFWPIDTAYWVKCKQSDRKWLYWLLSQLPLASLDSSTGVPGLNRHDVYRLGVFEPSDREKCLIAKVLDTIDTTIRQTEAIIAKLKQVKQGLLHDLLTRGIDANGELRPPQSQAPHLYKRSPLGWIPIEWDVGPVADWCERLTVGVVNSATHAYVSQGVPFIRSQNVKPNRIDTSDILYVTEGFNLAHCKSELRAGDVVIVRTGYPGTAAVVPPELDGSNCFSLVVAAPAEKLLSPHFLAHYLNSSIGKGQVGRLQFGSAQHNFNVGEMRLLLMARPSLTEQHTIIEMISVFEARLIAVDEELRKLNRQKMGLMDDLLTGRVRVTPLLEAAGSPP